MKYVFSICALLILIGHPIMSKANDNELDSKLYDRARNGDTISVQALIDNGANEIGRAHV